MDICHLKNAHLEPKLQKYKGRVVLRWKIVKDDSGAYAVFTEQGSFAFQMTAAKIMDKITRLCWTSSWCSIGLYSSTIGGCSQSAENSKVRMSRSMDTSSTTQMAKIISKHWRSRCTSCMKFIWLSVSRGCQGKDNFEEALLELGWEKIPSWECMFGHRTQTRIMSVSTCGWHQNGWKAEYGFPCGRNWWKGGYWRIQIISWPWRVGMYSAWLQTEWNNWSEWESVWITYFCWWNRKITGNISNKNSSVVLRHGRTCSWMCRAVLWTGKQESAAILQKISSPCVDDRQFKQEDLESVGELSEVCSHIVLKCLYLARIGRPDTLWSVNKLARSVTKWTQACDRRLARLISYIHHTNDFRQYCHVGNTAQHCRMGLSQDSDFAGDIEDSKSTSGGVLCIFGSGTFVPGSWMCKKPSAVSHSSTESEIISLDAGLRLDGIPALDLWDLIVAVLHGNTYQSNQERGDPCTNSVNTTPQLTCFRGAKVCTKWLQETVTITAYSLTTSWNWEQVTSWNWDQDEIGTKSGKLRIGHDCVVLHDVDTNDNIHDCVVLHDANTNDNMTTSTDFQNDWAWARTV